MLVLSSIAGNVTNQWLVLIFSLVFLIAFFDGWAAPARNALVPSLVEESRLIKANSLLSVSDQIVQLVAWPAGSILLVLAGPDKILWLTLLLHTVSTVFMGSIRQTGKHPQQEGGSRLETLKQGWGIIWHSKQLRTINMMNVLETLANAVWIAAILFVFVSEALNKGENWWGFINGSFFAGMLIGGLLIYRYSATLERNLGKTMLLSTFSLILITFLFGNTSISTFALFLSFLFGIPQMARDVAETTIIQKNAREQLLAKVYSARGTLIHACFGFSSLLMGWIAEEFGVRVSFQFAAILFVCSFLIAVKNRKHLYGSEQQSIDLL
ncbi:MFS transporter [Neobacillus sp. Marseille-QA0830]